jgi:hypothetical protein
MLEGIQSFLLATGGLSGLAVECPGLRIALAGTARRTGSRQSLWAATCREQAPAKRQLQRRVIGVGCAFARQARRRPAADVPPVQRLALQQGKSSRCGKRENEDSKSPPRPGAGLPPERGAR